MKEITVKKFLNEHGFYTDLDLVSLTKDVQNDMRASLAGKAAGQEMICTYIDPSAIEISKKSVVVIDAGGTNFRSSLVAFNDDGTYAISQFEKTKMPGIERELSKSEFFGQIAKNIERFKDSCDEICFCFSYAMRITEEKDGILINFAKEVKAPEVVGTYIGSELKNSLKENGWSKIPEIILLNDTASALLAGTGSKSKKYSSFIGFILGTGLNASYVQNASAEYELKKQIIVCESAKFDGFKYSDFDIILDEKSVNPRSSPFEKLCSGAYLGPLVLETIQMGAKEGLFSEDFASSLLKKESLSLIEVSTYLEHSDSLTHRYSDMFDSENATQKDCETLFEIFNALTARMAQISAVILAACVLQCDEGKTADEPICIACNGSSFFKTYKVIERTKEYLAEILKNFDFRAFYYEFLSGEVDITVGTAMAAFA